MVHEWNYKPDPIILLTKQEEAALGSEENIARIKTAMAGQTARARDFGGAMPMARNIQLPNGFSRRIVSPAVYGMELEIEYTREDQRAAENLSAKWDRAATALLMYFKKDSSLKNGFEIVSHPRSQRSWYEIKNQFKDMLRSMRDEGFRSYDTGRCGMHFHICRTAFQSEMHLAKFIKFWNENHKLAYALSRRSAESMKKYSYIYKSSAESLHSLVGTIRSACERRHIGIRKFIPMQQFQTPHHASVTLTRNTVEVRIFRGTLNTSTILATIDMLEKIIEVTAYSGYNDLSVKSVVSKIPNNKKNKRTIKMLSKSKEVNRDSISRDKDFKEEGRTGFKEHHAEFRKMLMILPGNGKNIIEKMVQAMNADAIAMIKTPKPAPKKKKSMYEIFADDAAPARQTTTRRTVIPRPLARPQINATMNAGDWVFTEPIFVAEDPNREGN